MKWQGDEPQFRQIQEGGGIEDPPLGNQAFFNEDKGLVCT
jgi:hypothetical protein